MTRPCLFLYRISPLVLSLLLACAPHAAQAQAQRCAASAPACLSGSLIDSTPLTAPARAQGKRLTEIQGISHLAQTRLNATLSSSVTLLLRQNLHSIDPDNRLPDASLHALSAMMTSDITTAVSHAFRNIDQTRLLSALADSYARQLTSTEMEQLIAYYGSVSGQRYLAFRGELNATLGAGMNQLGTHAFVFARAQQPDSALLAQRRALISMSSLARQLQAAGAAGLVKPSGAAFGLITEFLAMQSGAQLDQINLRYAKDLERFSKFQLSAAAMNQARSEWLWGQESSALFTPALKQAEQDLALDQQKWRNLAARSRQNTASSPH